MKKDASGTTHWVSFPKYELRAGTHDRDAPQSVNQREAAVYTAALLCEYVARGEVHQSVCGYLTVLYLLVQLVGC